MTRSRRLRVSGMLAGAAALVFLMVGPVLGVFHPAPDADHLRLTEDFEGFFYGDHDPDGSGTAVVEQFLTLGRGCEISPLSGDLVTLSSYLTAGGGLRGPGLTQLGMGVKQGGSNGTPCSEIGGNEVLVIEPAAGKPDAALAWYKLFLNVQPKFDGWVHVEMYSGITMVAHHQLLTGDSIAAFNAANPLLPPEGVGIDDSVPYTATTSVGNEIEACANPSDSGPDSGPNDDCLWTIDPEVVFDRVEIYTTVGSVAVKGGGDFAAFNPLTDSPEETFDSLFFRSPVVAVDDSYEMDERDPSDPSMVATLTESLPGVLDNDSDNLEVHPAVVSPGGLTTQLGSFTVASDGSFTYTPNPAFVWTDGVFSYQDTWQYTARDSTLPGITDTATVTITVHRVICSNETVTDIDGGIVGSFTLLASSPICKRYEVEAHESDGPSDPSTITFTPEGNGGGKEVFRGVLTFDPLPSPDGSFFVGLEYDPDNDGPLPAQPLLPCIAPVFTSGLVTSATLPPLESWCLAGGSFVANSTGTAFIPTAQVIGEEDPRFSFK